MDSIPCHRILAVATLTIALPLVLLKLPWFPATFQTFLETVSESTVNGTAGYIREHNETLVRLVIALVLYAFGLWAMFGLLGVILGLCRRLTTQRLVWISALIVGVGLPIFEAPYINRGTDSTDRFYIFLVIYIPIGVGVLASAPLVLSFF